MDNDNPFAVIAGLSMLVMLGNLFVNHVRESECQVRYNVSDCAWISLPIEMRYDIIKNEPKKGDAANATTNNP